MPLISENFQCKPGVEFRITPFPSCESAILVVLDEVVVRITRESKGTEAQRIDDREFQQPQVWLFRLQVRQVKRNEVMTQNVGRILGKGIQSRQRRPQVTPIEQFTLSGIGPQSGKGTYTAVT